MVEMSQDIIEVTNQKERKSLRKVVKDALGRVHTIGKRKEAVARVFLDKGKGKITINDGATKAIKKGYSILPAGIVSSEGNYEKGDLIKIIDQNKIFIGTGLTHFNNSEVELIKGSKSENIETILGYRGKDEVVHRDDLVLEKK